MSASGILPTPSQGFFWVPPIRGAHNESLPQNFFPFEREQLDRFLAWDRTRLRTVWNQRIRADLPVLLRPAKTTTGLERELGGRQSFLGFALSGRTVQTPRIVFEDPDVVVEDGRPYVLAGAERRAIVVPHAGCEEAVWVNEFRPATREEFLRPASVTPRETAQLMGALGDDLHAERSLLESLLLPFGGSPPRPGAGAGLDAAFGAPGLGETDLLGVLSMVRNLVPPWNRESTGRPLWGGSAKAAPIYDGYSIRFGAFAQQRAGSHQPGTDVSAFLHGGAGGSSFFGMLYGSDLPILRTKEEVSALELRTPRDETSVATVDLLVRLHAFDPALPSQSETAEGLTDAAREIESSTQTLVEGCGFPRDQAMSVVRAGHGLTESLLRSTLARARLGAKPKTTSRDIVSSAKAYSDGIAAFLKDGRRADLRRLLLDVGLEVSRKEQDRRLAIELALRENPDSSLQDLWERASVGDRFRNQDDFERVLNRLIAEGWLINPKPGSYRRIGP